MIDGGVRGRRREVELRVEALRLGLVLVGVTGLWF